MKLRTPDFHVERFDRNPYGTNCYLVMSSGTTDAVIIDPALEPEELAELTATRGLTVRYVINTHGHYDHIAGNRLVEMLDTHPVLAVHKEDVAYLADPNLNLSGVFGAGYVSPKPGRVLQEGDVLTPGRGLRIEVLHTPGHTPGSICLRMRTILFTGDLLFASGVGRTDLPGGDARALGSSLARVAAIDDDLTILPGHGPESTLGTERHYYVRMDQE